MDERRGPGRPVEVDPDGLALVALRLFADRGVDAVTMSEVAETAGISRRTLFRWFPSKAALVWGGTSEAYDRFDAAWADGNAGHEGEGSGALLARVRAAYEVSIAPLGASADITRLRLRLIDDNPIVYAWGHDLRARMTEQLTRHVAEVLEAPADSLRVVALVAAINAASYAALVWWARHGEGSTPARVLDEALADLTSAFE